MGSRRIMVIKAPWDYYWPKVSAMTCIRVTGPALVKDQLADAAIAAGIAIEIETKPATKRRRSAKPKGNAANTGQSARMDRANLAAHDRAGSVDTLADAG